MRIISTTGMSRRIPKPPPPIMLREKSRTAIPGGPQVAECRQLHPEIETEAGHAKRPGRDQFVAVFQRVEKLVVTLAGVRFPPAQRIAAADVIVAVQRDVPADGAALQGGKGKKRQHMTIRQRLVAAHVKLGGP